ncbi:hypothetical protein V6N11_073122 [Hibiscus sabdariffa]|uniref:Reverse transcriptase domain-containing protein n=1 Tax=Hibiscus sabdariffa TaxID=183260 RepID=A0ABR2P967_9ROSI
MGLAPLPYCPMFSEPGPLARFLPICLGVHRSPCASVCVYVVIAWLSSGPLLCVRPAPSADPWALVPRCAICGALGALRSGLRARLAASLAALLGPSRGLLVYSVTQWLGMKVTPGFLEHITPSVSNSMNASLGADFTTDEIVAAFRDINPWKSPGIDGLPSGFFRQYWNILGDDFVSLCLALLRDQAVMASVNETVIVLIPKVDRPASMRQLRPISLCTVIYKTVAKVDLIMRCVSSVSFRARARGTLSSPFHPQCGLRQGDPLSPFLFLFCTQGLSVALLAAQHVGQLPGLRASKHGPPVNHLLFADDRLVFLRNELAEVHCLKDILSTYSSVSGQRVNFD